MYKSLQSPPVYHHTSPASYPSPLFPLLLNGNDVHGKSYCTNKYMTLLITINVAALPRVYFDDSDPNWAIRHGTNAFKLWWMRRDVTHKFMVERTGAARSLGLARNNPRVRPSCERGIRASMPWHMQVHVEWTLLLDWKQGLSSRQSNSNGGGEGYKSHISLGYGRIRAGQCSSTVICLMWWYA